MKKYILAIGLTIIASVFANKLYSQKAIFLHHSTGSNVYYQGNVAGYIDNYNSIHSTSIELKEWSYPNTPWPWDNYPYDYWKLWIGGSCNSTDPNIACLDTLTRSYDLIIFKHCFPGAGILEDLGTPDVNSDRKSLENYKAQYRALRTLMDSYPSNKFMVWTLVPLHRLATDADQAARAYQFVNWVKNTWLTEDGKEHPNIIIFDFYSLVAELSPSPAYGQQYCLKYDYEGSHTESDSHPNTAANEYVGPIFAQAVIDALLNPVIVHVDSIKIVTSGDVKSITTPGGTLQLVANVYPENATNKSIDWSIENITGQSTISTNGLVTAVANGSVIATATAKDGSGSSGSFTITISGQSENTILVENITIQSQGNTDTISIPGGKLQLTANVLPSNATNKNVNWSIGNQIEHTIVDSTGLVTAVANGSDTVIATARDGSGVTGSFIVTVSGQSEITFIKEHKTSYRIIISSKSLLIDSNQPALIERVKIFNTNGIAVFMKDVNSAKASLILPDIVAGNYLVQIISGHSFEVIKIYIP